MSTLLYDDLSQPIVSASDLARYFHGFAKAHECMRMGLEAEFFAVDSVSGRAISYSGEGGIESILKRLAVRFGYEPVKENGAVIALRRSDRMVTLEPGGQVELSAPPVRTAFEIEEQVAGFTSELKAIAEEMPGLTWISVGIQPFSTASEIRQVPKKRYAIMKEHFRSRGRLSLEMMRVTATNQVNFDYLSEAHAMDSLRTVLGLTTLVSALFSNSSFSEGKPNGFQSRRMAIWSETDRERTGLLTQFLRPGAGFHDYLDYVLDMPLLFLVRAEEWIPVRGFSFRKFLERGYEGRHALLSDFELHLSTAFPEARLKQYLEIRGMDAQSPLLIPAVAAFWKGLLYHPDARAAAWNLVAGASEQERLEFHERMPREGLRGRFLGYPVLDLARELVDLSCASLGKQTTCEERRSECLFLERIREEITRPGLTPSERLLARWTGEFQESPSRLVSYLSL